MDKLKFIDQKLYNLTTSKYIQSITKLNPENIGVMIKNGEIYKILGNVESFI